MFEEDQLEVIKTKIIFRFLLFWFIKKVLGRGDYEFILDRACTQFEPDDPDYIRVSYFIY